jgi:hypothetical protein
MRNLWKKRPASEEAQVQVQVKRQSGGRAAFRPFSLARAAKLS